MFFCNQVLSPFLLILYLVNTICNVYSNSFLILVLILILGGHLSTLLSSFCLPFVYHDVFILIFQRRHLADICPPSVLFLSVSCPQGYFLEFNYYLNFSSFFSAFYSLFPNNLCCCFLKAPWDFEPTILSICVR